MPRTPIAFLPAAPLTPPARLRSARAVCATRTTCARKQRPSHPTARASLGRLRTLSALNSKSFFHGGFVWARRPLNGPFRWVSARGRLEHLRAGHAGLLGLGAARSRDCTCLAAASPRLLSRAGCTRFRWRSPPTHWTCGRAAGLLSERRPRAVRGPHHGGRRRAGRRHAGARGPHQPVLNSSDQLQAGCGFGAVPLARTASGPHWSKLWWCTGTWRGPRRAPEPPV